ncbi:hypothetical protein KIK06_23355 [Nocardiopsis sp. EMB25]|uniref:hypothetical protein n=1 Tax=Nocardiopsis sp. EMB25 TaxID=2835867 RepID=UPI0022842276|nr:hypothetical protein [Nocardiopsis sp. EMB25]MCY9786824.1 hypothetical protein [Nocardiopsis sp. EMB25]
MAEEYGVFTATPITADTSYARLVRRHAADGVVASGPDAGNQLTVTANTTSQLTVSSGYAMVGGWWYRTDAPVPLSIPPNGASQERRDLVVLRADTGTGTCYPHIIEGTAGSSSWPSPERDPAGTWDTVLARYTIAGATAVVGPGDVDLSVRQWTAPSGAIPCASTVRPPNPWDGMLAFETDTGRLITYTQGAWRLVADTTYPSPWQLLTLRSGYEPAPGTTPRWRYDAPDIIRLDGRIRRQSGGALTSGEYVARVPSAIRTSTYRRWAVATTSRSGGTTSRLEMLSTSVSPADAGRLLVYTDYDPTWVDLNGSTYVLD